MKTVLHTITAHKERHQPPQREIWALEKLVAHVIMNIKIASEEFLKMI